MVWSPQQYHRFSQERRQPFDDLLALIKPAERVLDLGCGTGELTLELHAAAKSRKTLGIDHSPEMLARAEPLAREGLRFERGDLRGWTTEERFDLVFSNAALQWLPVEVFDRALEWLAPGGQVAIQVPSNHDSHTHRVARELSPFFAPEPAHIPHVLTIVDYAEKLAHAGFSGIHVREQVYLHWLEGPESAIEWVKGTLLTAWKGCLSSADYDAFLALYRARLLRELPQERPFLLPFKRILIWARKPA